MPVDNLCKCDKCQVIPSSPGSLGITARVWNRVIPTVGSCAERMPSEDHRANGSDFGSEETASKLSTPKGKRPSYTAEQIATAFATVELNRRAVR